MLRFPSQLYFDSFHDLKDGLTFFCSGNSFLTFDFSSHFCEVTIPYLLFRQFIEANKAGFYKIRLRKRSMFSFSQNQ